MKRYSVCMPATPKQQKEELVPELDKLGYKPDSMYDNTCSYIRIDKNYYADIPGLSAIKNIIHLNTYNKDLFLALAKQNLDDKYAIGNILICKNDTPLVRKNTIIQIINRGSFSFDYTICNGDPKPFIKMWHPFYDNKSTDSLRLATPQEIIELYTPKQKEMTQKISKTNLKEIWNVACETWKKKFEEDAKKDPFQDYVEYTDEEVKKMFDACTPGQLPIVSKYFTRPEKESPFILKDGVDIYCDELNNNYFGSKVVLHVGCGLAPQELMNKCFVVVDPDIKVEVIEHDKHQFITFKYK